MVFIWRLKKGYGGLIETFRNHPHIIICFKFLMLHKRSCVLWKLVNQTVCFGRNNLHSCLSPKACIYKARWTIRSSHIRVRVTLHITTQSGSLVLRLKWPHSPNKDASLLKAPNSTMNLVSHPTTSLPPPPLSLPLQSVLPAPTVCLWKWSVPERWAEPLHVHIGPRGIPACPLLLLSFVSQMDTN